MSPLRWLKNSVKPRVAFQKVVPMKLAQAKARHAELAEQIQAHDYAYYVLAKPVSDYTSAGPYTCTILSEPQP